MSVTDQIPIAHRQENTNRVQTIREHSEETAALAASFCVEEMKETVYASAMLHDVGKYQRSFQCYIRGDHRKRIPHAVCGAKALSERYPAGLASQMMEYMVAGHHAGLMDYGSKSDIADDPTLCGTLIRKTEPFDGYRTELAISDVDQAALLRYLIRDCATPEDAAEKFAFFTRYGFSCLTDADSLNTETFETGHPRAELKADFAACLARVNARLAGFRAETPLQAARSRLQAQVFERSGTDADVYFMNMPTGSGKTLCGLKFALERAIRSGKKRLLYVIPYNSIIDQTAQTFEQLLGDDAAILRHQSTWVYEDAQALDEDEKLARTKATENWDAQIIITTVVQFFDSMYGDRRSQLRRLHNMQDAVLVFDEAHLLPRDYLQPCLKGIAYLVKYLRCEAVLLTATMPNYTALFERYGLPGLVTADLVPQRQDFTAFRKCLYVSLGILSDESLILRAMESPTCLVIVNSRKSARELYAACPAGRKFHLSTWMTVLDRQRVIREIRESLQALEQRYPGLTDVPRDERIAVFSTSLVEAGVDFDFHTVFRELTGLDSILQSGGRCNREGKQAMANVYVVEREGSAGAPANDARVAITRELMRSFDPLDTPECIVAYYARLFAAHEDELTRRSIVEFAKARECFDPRNPTRLPFRSYAQVFHLIDAPTCAIAVPCDAASRALIARIPAGLSVKERRQLQMYACSVTLRDFQQLLNMHMVESDESGLCWLKREADYDPETGIRFECGDMIY